MLIKASEACLPHTLYCFITVDLNKEDLERWSHDQTSGGRCVCSPRGKSSEAKQASSTDQLLLGGVGVLTEKCHPGCVMQIADEQRGFLFSHERGAEMRPCEDAGIKERGGKKTDLTSSKP